MALSSVRSSIEYKVTIEPKDSPWESVVVGRFSGSSAERDAFRLAGVFDGLGNTVVRVSCAQCW